MRETEKIWMNGELVDWADAKIHVGTHGLHYGTGVFEGIRCYETPKGPAVFRLADHMQRLHDSARLLYMELPYSIEELRAATHGLIDANGLPACYIRPIAFYGSEAMGVAARSNPVRVAIAAWPWGAYLGAEGLEKGIRVRTSSYTHHHPNTTMGGAKAVTNYAVSILANQEATTDGYEEAMMLDPQGYICQGSGENVFIVRGGKLATPDLAGGALAGITRDTVMTFANELGIPVQERRITRDEVYVSDEAFFTGTAAEITPIREFDNRLIGDGARGPITTRLQSMFFDTVNGRNPAQADWLTYVER
jgi:branched-chain amino acid aminotransferase